MKTKKLMASILATALVLTTACAVVPIKADAATGLTNADFTQAKNNAGVMTDKGIIYVKDEEDPTNGTFKIKPGEYLFTEDINLSEEVDSYSGGDFIFDLNGKTWKDAYGGAAINIKDSNVTVKGNGTISNPTGFPVFFTDNCNTTIMNGTFKGVVSVCAEDAAKSLVIDNVKMESLVVQGKGLNAVINNGEFVNDLTSACTAINEVTLTINGGTFASVASGLLSNYNPSRDPSTGQPIVQAPPKSITINGGTFKSLGGADDSIGGLTLGGLQNVKLNGGTFTAEGSALGGIVVRKGDATPQAEFASFLGDGYKYSEDLAINTGSVTLDKKIDVYYTQKTISVVKADAAAPTTQTTDATATNSSTNNSTDNSTDNLASASKVSKAPKTGDNCILRFIGYLLAF